ncbi:MAG TPA: hypothetical protein VM674_07460 [Candidatus Acidoferrum sp.]|nr:hypothetical protein [Candidatus Acidoferrum sp.]
MRLSRHFVLLSPIIVAAGLLVAITSASASASDTHWTPTGAQQAGGQNRPVWSIAVSPTHPATMLMATQGHGVLRSADSGATWSSVMSSVDNAWVVRFDPQQPTTAYAGTQSAGLFKSTDEGKTWTAQSQGLTNLDVRAIDVGGGLVVVGTAQGVFYSSDGTTSWHAVGLDGMSVAAVAILPKSDGVSLFAGVDNGSGAASGYLYKTEGATASWSIVKGSFPSDAVVAALALGSAPSGGTDPPVIAGTSEGLFRSDDRGASRASIGGLPTTDFNLVLFNPANPDQIYAASDGDQGNGGVFRSLDRGATWTTFGSGLPSKPRVTALALQPLNPAQVVAATWNPTDDSAGTYRVADSAATIAGVAPTAAPAASATASAAPRLRLPSVSSPVRRSASSPAYQTYAIAAVALLGLVAVIILRRWRIRREDRRTYAP